MKQISTRYNVGDKFFVDVDSEYRECVIIDIGAYSITKSIQEYIVQFIDDKFITTVKENQLIHKEHLDDSLFESWQEEDIQ